MQKMQKSAYMFPIAQAEAQYVTHSFQINMKKRIFAFWHRICRVFGISNKT